MARRKKYPKLPNGYGSIRYLGPGRRNPYAVHPPVTTFTRNGIAVTPKALCYVDDWMVGFAVLTAYKAGTYTPGMELTLAAEKSVPGANNALVQRLLADYNLTKAGEEKLTAPKKTFAQVYEEFYHWKYEQDKSRSYSNASKKSTVAAFRNCAVLHNQPFADLRHQDLQAVVDDCPKKHASKELIVSLFHQLYTYAEIYGLTEKDHSAHVKINQTDDDEHGIPFTEIELRILWQHKEDPVVEMLLVMCYSGFRIAAYQNLTVNLEDKYFQGGVKTAAGKSRIVPVHSAIFPLVEKRILREGCLLPVSPHTFRYKMYTTLSSLKIAKHTPHDCRHTFSALCEKYGVREADRKRMLGHSFGADITNGIYGHREIEDLRAEIEKIRVCDELVTNR